MRGLRAGTPPPTKSESVELRLEGGDGPAADGARRGARTLLSALGAQALEVRVGRAVRGLRELAAGVRPPALRVRGQQVLVDAAVAVTMAVTNMVGEIILLITTLVVVELILTGILGMVEALILLVRPIHLLQMGSIQYNYI